MKKPFFFILFIIFLHFPLSSQDNTEIENDFDNSSETSGEKELPNLSLEKPNVFNMAKNAALRWKLDVGDIIEIRKKSSQDIKITGEEGTGKFLQSDHIRREVMHRVILETIGVDNEKGYLVEGSFYSQVNYKDSPGGLYQEEENQESGFYIQPRGTFIVPPESYMPNVRNIPVFPSDKDPNFSQNPLKDGDTWSFPGIEVMRVEELENIPLNVKYEYRGSRKVKKNDEEKIFHNILYNVEFNHKFKKTSKPENPRQMFGYVTAKLIWDEKEGIPYFMTEDYDLVIMYNNGVSHEFKIISKSNYYKKHRPGDQDKENVRKTLEENLSHLNEANLTVESTKKGISIQIPDILFNTNASNLTGQHIDVLQKIGKVIKPYLKNRQLLVRGHTDNVGNAAYNDELSKRRALSVAKYLFDNLEIPLDSLSYEGAGSRFPVADNSTAPGRKKNRRVEILLLDN